VFDIDGSAQEEAFLRSGVSRRVARPAVSRAMPTSPIDRTVRLPQRLGAGFAPAPGFRSNARDDSGWPKPVDTFEYFRRNRAIMG
jgi:hypothetical protein